jgi:acyl-CoA thioesterase FadM
MAFALLSLVLLLLFASVDVWYFVRCAFFIAPLRIWQRLFPNNFRRMTREELLEVTLKHGVVLPSDMDLQLHMNNSKYLREMDFGRIHHFVSTNFYRSLVSFGGDLVVGATMIRYRRSLRLWQRFSLRTRILCWDDNALYVEQRFLCAMDGFVCAIALLKMVTKGVAVGEVLERLCVGNTNSPVFPPEVESWAEAISRSSNHLKQEGRSRT